MRILLVDDEVLARLRLRGLIEARPALDAQVVGEAGDADEAMALLQVMPVDLVLLDIRMPGAQPNIGLRLAAQLQALPRPPAVVFVTAHGEHALRAFELDAVDYLTKPVRSDRLAAALQRVRQRLGLGSETAPPLAAPVLVVHDRGRLLRLPLAEVLVLKAELKYVTLRSVGHEHVLDESLAELEQRLLALGGDFLRIHRNALVARSAIRALERRDAGAAGEGEGEGWAVRVAPLDEWLAVSRRQLVAVRAALAAQAAPP